MAEAKKSTGCRPSRARARRRSVFVTVLLACAVGVGCGSGTEPDAVAGLADDYAEALQVAPRQIADLYASGDALLDGGEATYQQALAETEGYPLVVNNWASWCGPCRTEFPFFQELAVEEIERVAFLGVVSEDSEAAAEAFLRDNPLPYPSITDPEGDLARWIDSPLIGYPNTLFYDRRGELVFVKQGPYESEEALASDIGRYALDDAAG